MPVVITDGQQREFVELGGKKHSHKNQAEGRAKRILNHRAQVALHKLSPDAKHRLAAEPCGKGGGDNHDQWQVATRNGEISRVLHAARGPQTDANGDQ